VYLGQGSHRSPANARIKGRLRGNLPEGEFSDMGNHKRGMGIPQQGAQIGGDEKAPTLEFKTINSHKELIFRVCTVQSQNQDQIALQ
jgi:hypothetical protein